mmetsp:Transcript_47767/g.35017  ORF Transcript_47767/g.35017 Transcript_47767/m.35017 type:complete len:132 (-) Transcript_47767:859-1254(-)
MRAKLQNHNCHLENSINLPLNYCDDEFFINWNPEKISTEIIKNPVKKSLFDQRKRLYVCIICSEYDTTNFLDKLHRIFDVSSLDSYVKKYVESKDKVENLLSLRNALLLYKALKKERIREIYICVNGFNTF